MIFIKYREVSTHTIFPNFIDLSAETVLSSRFGGHKGGVAKGGEGGEEEAYVFNLIPLANQGESPGQPKRSLRVATTVRFNSNERAEFEISQRSLKGGGEAGRAHHCMFDLIYFFLS